jgi:SepF-like predicted cell division protein (DUF552 family)
MRKLSLCLSLCFVVCANAFGQKPNHAASEDEVRLVNTMVKLTLVAEIQSYTNIERLYRRMSQGNTCTRLVASQVFKFILDPKDLKNLVKLVEDENASISDLTESTLWIDGLVEKILKVMEPGVDTCLAEVHTKSPKM